MVINLGKVLPSKFAKCLKRKYHQRASTSASSSSSSSTSSSSSSSTCCVDLQMEERLRIECRNENERLLAERKSFESDAERRWQRHFRAELESSDDAKAENWRRAEESRLRRKKAEISCAREKKMMEEEMAAKTTAMTAEIQVKRELICGFGLGGQSRRTALPLSHWWDEAV